MDDGGGVILSNAIVNIVSMAVRHGNQQLLKASYRSNGKHVVDYIAQGDPISPIPFHSLRVPRIQKVAETAPFYPPLNSAATLVSLSLVP